MHLQQKNNSYAPILFSSSFFPKGFILIKLENSLVMPIAFSEPCIESYVVLCYHVL